MNFKNVDEALDFAIKNEEAAFKFYSGLAAKAEAPNLRKTFEDFAEEEKGHKTKLEAVKFGQEFITASDKVMDLKISDYTLDTKPSSDMSYQEVLVLAMKAEKNAFKLYSDLAACTEEPAIKNTFLALAQEEAKHKLRFEIEYDDQILAEN